MSTDLRRIAVLGDVGGHADRLTECLTQLGVQLDDQLQLQHWPDDLTVIQAGDLLHKGPDSDVCVDLADRLLADDTADWTQLLGNHEMHYIDGAPTFWRDEAQPWVAEIVRRWWADRTATLAVAIDTTQHGPMVVSHGGLAVDRWQTLGSPTDVRQAVAAVNRWQPDQPHLAATAGVMLGGQGPRSLRDVPVSPVWCEVTRELLLPWARFAGKGGTVPFGQVHGHSTPIMWRGRHAPRAPEWLDDIIQTFDPKTRQVHSRVGNKDIFSIDPCFSKQAPRPLTPLLLNGRLLPNTEAGDVQAA